MNYIPFQGAICLARSLKVVNESLMTLNLGFNEIRVCNSFPVQVQPPVLIKVSSCINLVSLAHRMKELFLSLKHLKQMKMLDSHL